VEQTLESSTLKAGSPKEIKCRRVGVTVGMKTLRFLTEGVTWIFRVGFAVRRFD
jgi:hypothetical protein